MDREKGSVKVASLESGQGIEYFLAGESSLNSSPSSCRSAAKSEPIRNLLIMCISYYCSPPPTSAYYDIQVVGRVNRVRRVETGRVLALRTPMIH